MCLDGKLTAETLYILVGLRFLRYVFSHSGWLFSGLAGKIGEMDQLKVKGLIIGPVHVSEVDNPEELKLDTISQEAGTLESLKKIIHEAHRRGEHSEALVCH